MSPKECSLAVEEAIQNQIDDEVGFEPQLTVLVNHRYYENTTADVILISGEISVSF